MNTTELKHTPGPWEVVEHNWSDTSIYAPGREFRVAGISIESEATEENQSELEARAAIDARLISAAPDLLEAFEVSLARAYAAGHQRGHEDTVEAIFTEVHRDDASTYFAEDIREMMSNNCLPEAKAAIDKATGAARP